jgi:uncharacterized protein YjbJ (UPF0337 family)
MALTSVDVENYIRRRLGEPVIPVELDATQITEAEAETLRVYSSIAPQLKKAQITLQTGVRVYGATNGLTDVGRGIIQAAIPPSKYRFGLGWGFGDEFSVFDSSVVQDLGYYHTAISYYKQARKVLSAHFEWQYDLERQELLIHPAPQEALTLYYVYVDDVLIGEIPRRHEDWVLNYALLEAKNMLGEIREFLGSVQGNQTTMQLNGQQLKAEASLEVREAEKDKLRARIGDRFALPLVDS